MSEKKIYDNSLYDLDNTKLTKKTLSESVSKRGNGEYSPTSHEEYLRQLVEDASSKAEWVTMDEGEVNKFMDNFIEYSDDNNIEWDRFNYEVFDYDYYKNKFPKFDDDVIDILVKCSEKKIYNDKPNQKKDIKQITDEDFIVKFD